MATRSKVLKTNLGHFSPKRSLSVSKKRKRASKSVSKSARKSVSKSASKSVSKSVSKSTRKKHKSTNSSPISSSQKRRRSSSQKRRAHFLSAICSDSNVCLAFGRYADEIKKHFGGFASFKHAVAPIRRIGEQSENGFVNQVEYEHRGYTAYALLKSAKTPEADNLLYEYVVGQYINRLNKLYPCFLETYGFYMYTSEAPWLQMQNTPLLQDVSVLTTGLKQQNTINYNDACRESSKLAILIQYFKNIISLDRCSREPRFIQEELMNALFQLYVPLAQLKNNFTHYDLHLKNVYMYKPVMGKYIEYHYWVSSTRAISFKSSYMLKIIDYGRSYFKDDQTGQNAKEIYTEELCDNVNTAECNDPEEITGVCGEKVGFGWLTKNLPNPSNNFHISAQQKNISHDLLPLKRIKGNHAAPKPNNLTSDLQALVAKVVYTDEFGTKENKNVGYPHTILNVEDAAKFIMSYVASKKYQDINNLAYNSKTKLGDLHIFLDGKTPMRFDAV